MSDRGTFVDRVTAARRAAWFVVLIAIGLQMIAYFFFLAMEQGALDGLITSGLWGDISRDELTRLTFLYVTALKLMSTAIFMGALFLTFWVRGLRRIG